MTGSEMPDSFTAEPLPQKIINKMMGKSFVENDVISLEDLAYLKVLHYGFDDKDHVGEMVVHRDVAEELLEIFKELYDKKFPIERMELIDEYDADDDASMGANNSSAFCYRQLTGGGELSLHSFGIAVDINPMYNPYVRKWDDGSLLILPPSAGMYIERDPAVKGKIYPGNDCYNAFVSRGWEWGGDWPETSERWSDIADNHHFQKIR